MRGAHCPVCGRRLIAVAWRRARAGYQVSRASPWWRDREPRARARSSTEVTEIGGRRYVTRIAYWTRDELAYARASGEVPRELVWYRLQLRRDGTGRLRYQRRYGVPPWEGGLDTGLAEAPSPRRAPRLPPGVPLY